MTAVAQFYGKTSEASMEDVKVSGKDGSKEVEVVQKVAEMGIELLKERSSDDVAAMFSATSSVSDQGAISLSLTVGFANNIVEAEQMEGEARRRRAGEEILG